MDLIIKFMNVLIPPVALILLCLIFPPYLLFKFLSCMKRFVCRENLAGKVVLITGASSGIGEHLAYEYARRGARLALVARREGRLQAVADKARQLGSPDVIVISSDVSKSTNFWGSAYATHFAIPHLKRSRGKIVVIASTAGWFPTPRLSFYNASKAALISLYDTLRIEVGSDIGITIVTPGMIESEMTEAEFRSQTKMEFVMAESTETCAKAIVNGACRGERYLTEPSWVRIMFVLQVLCPELTECYCRLMFMDQPKPSKKNA